MNLRNRVIQLELSLELSETFLMGHVQGRAKNISGAALTKWQDHKTKLEQSITRKKQRLKAIMPQVDKANPWMEVWELLNDKAFSKKLITRYGETEYELFLSQAAKLKNTHD